jgi:spore germination protein YaaH
VRRTAIALLSMLTAAVLVGLPTAAQADSPPPKKVASGWMPYWMTSPGRPQGVNSAVQNAGIFTDVSPFWYSATAKTVGGVQVRLNPNFSNGAANAAWAMGQLKGAGLVVLPSIADGSGKGRMAATLADPALRGSHVSDIVNLVMANGYDGIDLDYETFAFTDGKPSWAATQPNWTAFVTELAAALHGQGKQLAVTIPPPCTTTGVCGTQAGYWVYNMTGIAPAADRIRIMAYDYHVGSIGPIAPMPWVRAIVSYSASVMDSAKLQIGVPTYGRAWTIKNPSGALQTSGICPSTSSTAFRSLTSSQSISDADIPALIASVGKTEADVQWAPTEQENVLYYDKALQWTDASGVAQTCKASRVLWFVGPQAVLARTQLVGEFGLNAAAYWTVGGENPAQWALLGSYGQSLAPASTDVSVAGSPALVFGTPMTVTAVVTSRGAPVVGAAATVQFQPSGSKTWTDIQAASTAPDGTVSFQVQPSATGNWQVSVGEAPGRVAGSSAPFTTQVVSQVTATPVATKVPARSTIVVSALALPAMRGQKVALQIKRGDGWRNVARGTTNARGRDKLRATAPKVKGLYVYRVVAVGKAGILSGASGEFPIRVRK